MTFSCVHLIVLIFIFEPQVMYYTQHIVPQIIFWRYLLCTTSCLLKNHIRPHTEFSNTQIHTPRNFSTSYMLLYHFSYSNRFIKINSFRHMDGWLAWVVLKSFWKILLCNLSDMRIDQSNKLKLYYVSQNSYNLEAKPSNRNSNINQNTDRYNNWSFNKSIEAEQLVNIVYSAE